MLLVALLLDLGATLTGATLPGTFETKTGPIMNQGNCGCCYAFSASQTFSDRTNAKYGTNLVFSPQGMISCNYKYQPKPDAPASSWGGWTEGCAGGDAIVMFDWIKEKGQPTCTSSKTCSPSDPSDLSRECSGCNSGCAPYTGGWSSNGSPCYDDTTYKGNCDVPVCSTFAKCTPYTINRDQQPLCLDQPRPWPKYGPITIEPYIQSNISAHGTMSAAIRVYNEFQNFWAHDKKRVWKHSKLIE